MKRITMAHISTKLLVLLVLTLIGLSAGSAYASVWTDKADYPPGSVVTIHGDNSDGIGWLAGETINVAVSGPNGYSATCSGIANGAGAWSCQVQLILSPSSIGSYAYTATGQTSGKSQSGTFTDNISGDLDQCGNGPLSAPVNCDSTDSTDWQNGNLGSGKAHFVEGDSVPYRLKVDGITPGSTVHTLTIGWDTTQSGKHAIDYLTSFNRTVAAADPCAGISGCSGSPSTLAIPADPHVTGAGVTPVAGVFSLFGGTITGTSVYRAMTTANGCQPFPAADNATYAGSSTTCIQISFTAAVSNPVLAWGGHIATRNNWGQGAVDISGSSYHTHFVALDGSGGNQDRSLSADAVIFPATIQIVKNTVPTTANDTFNYTVSTTNPTSNGGTAVPANFAITTSGGTGSQTFSNILVTAQQLPIYTVVESDPGSTWALTALSCSVTSANGGGQTVTLASRTAEITVGEGENWVCTYTNTKQPTLTVSKVCVPVADTGKFNLKIDSTVAKIDAACGSDTGAVTTTIGSHTVSETQGTGTVLTNYTSAIGGDCAANGTITLAAGDNKTCTITNTLKAATLTVTKVLVPSSDAGTFNLQIDSVTKATGGDGTTTNAVTLATGNHTVGETGAGGTNLANYTPVISGDCDPATGGVTLNPGDAKSCTITNTLKPSSLTVNKVCVPVADTGKFNLKIDSTIAKADAACGSGTGAVTTPAGAHTVSEAAGTGTLLTGYSSAITGDCASDGTITLSPGDNKVCTITNTRLPVLTVNKVCVPSNDPGKFNLKIDSTVATTDAACGTGTGAAVTTIGSHTVSETAGTGTDLGNYTSAVSGDCTSGGSITLAAGDNKTCTITNTLKPATLTVNKVCVPANDPGQFNLQIDGSTAGTGANAVCGTGTTGAMTLATGGHSVSETAGTNTTLTNYTAVIGGDCSAAGAVTLNPGDAKTCTITNTLKPATLTVNKVCVPSNDTGLFNLKIDGSTAGTGANAACGSGTGAVTTPAGPHTVSETAGTGTLLTSYSSAISGDCASDGTITLSPGDNKTCTITNTKLPTLTVNKVCAPTNDPGKFNLQIDGSIAGTGANAACGSGTGAVQTTVGSHTVSETQGTGTVLTNYTAVISGACDPTTGSVTLAAGDNKTCTITNTVKPATLTVNKVCVPVADTGKFNLRIDGAVAGTGADATCGSGTGAVTTPAGQHTVSELAGTGTLLTNYSSAISGACASDGTVTLAPGDNKVCTITNTKLPTLTVNKVCVPTTDPGKFNLKIDTTIAKTDAACGTGTGAVVTTIGSHTVSETGGTGTNLTYYTAVISGACDPTTGSVTLAAGDAKTCTITNTLKPATLAVNKVCVPTTDAGKFNLKIDTTVAKTDGACGTGTGAVTTPAGAHTVSEAAGTGTLLTNYTSVISGDCSAAGAITLNPGDAKVCTITNTLKSHAKVVKTVAGAAPSGTQAFTFQLRQGASTGAAGTILESLVANAANGGVITFTTVLVPGQTYQLCEQTLPGWMTTLGPPFFAVYNPSGDNSVVCTDFSVVAGETKAFTINNTPPPGGRGLTIGFWKNWASCSGSNGGQKPVLDQTLAAAAAAGKPITLGTLVLNPTVLGPNVACTDAVNLLNKSTIKGSKMASDPLFSMTAQLVAADLNVAAGAGVCGNAVTAINSAHALLVKYGFNGNTYSPKLTSADATLANSLATTLDQYNNNKLC